MSDDADNKLVGPADEVQIPDEIESPDKLEVGQWYWVNDDEEKKWFGCVVHIGTNYAEVENPRRGSCRIHFDEFLSTCKYEPNPDKIIDGEISRRQAKVAQLLGRVKEITASLAIAPSPAISSGSETQALALRGSDQDMGEYSKALVKAKEKDLPDLFKQIEEQNESLAQWMTAKVVPLQAQASGLNAIIGTINDRIFSVELYAGLVERVERIKDGEPAALGEKVHLMQRRCYMDEECLAQYETGGMTFQNIREFDMWLARPENFNRILPFPRCLVAFRVRRNAKEREAINISDFFRIIEEEKADKWTFLYIRNGEQLYWMQTGIEFDEKLFPDLDRSRLTGKLWAKMFGSSVDELITDNEHTGILEDFARRKKEWKEKSKAYDAAIKTPEAKARAKAQGKKKPDPSCVDVPWPGSEPWDHHADRYIPYDKSNVHYDDITEKIEADIRQHNRIALILQGLLDRSPVLHPHPPWQIWTDEGFRAALELVYDDSRALVAGEKPDFEAYRAKLNESLKTGSVTVGQEEAWERYEAAKEGKRRDNDWRNRSDYRPTHFRPYGDPGPGGIARVARYSPRVKKCTYEWTRKRRTGWKEDPIHATFTTDTKRIFNVDAYKPGDFKQFFNDPRTRVEYLKWAPLLLEAEEYHAGNRKVEGSPAPPKPKKESSWAGRRQYQRRKLRKQLMNKAVRLVKVVTTIGGVSYEKGTLWRVVGGAGGTFTIGGITPDGRREEYAKRGISTISGVEASDFEVDATIPADPDDKPPESEKELDIFDDSDDE